jgi:branched-chain amino acid transport system ATP-binding protein
MSELLTLSGVETHIGRYHILHGVELGVPEGGTTMLLGRNGAGKTTTLRTIMGLWRASGGEIRLGGEGTLSGGQKQMLSFARAFIEERRLLLIDEPTKGLAPAIIGALIDCLREVKRRGATILLVEQNFRVAQEIGDTVGVMDNGRVIYTGAMSELAGDQGLQHRLLGLSLDTHQ